RPQAGEVLPDRDHTGLQMGLQKDLCQAADDARVLSVGPIADSIARVAAGQVEDRRAIDVEAEDSHRRGGGAGVPVDRGSRVGPAGEIEVRRYRPENRLEAVDPPALLVE